MQVVDKYNAKDLQNDPLINTKQSFTATACSEPIDVH